MSKKVLFLVTELDSASGICVQNVARELVSRGDCVYILTKSVNPSRKPVPASCGAQVYSVSGTWIDRVRSKYRDSKSVFGKTFYAAATAAERLGVVLCYPIWPLKDLFYCFRFGKKARHLASLLEIDAVIPVYNTIDALIAADSIKKANPRILYIPYLLDSFYGGQTPRLMSEDRKRRKALRWEKKLFARADGIVMMKSARGCYAQDGITPEYLRKTEFLDIPMLCAKEKKEQTSPEEKKETVFLFAGSMPRNIRDPQHLLQVFSRTDAPHWRLHMIGFGDFDSTIDDMAKKDPRIRRLGRVSHDEAMEAMEHADYLVNIGNTLSYMVPSKIFEYMAMDKPIISTYKISDDPCLPYLSLYPKAIALDERESLDVNARKLMEFVSEMEKSRGTGESVLGLTRPGMPLYANTPDAFAAYLQGIFDDRR